MQPKMKEGKGESLWEFLRRILPDVIKALMRYARVGTQVELARSAVINPNQISRYLAGTELPVHNYSTLGKNLGLSAGNMWWLLGDMIVTKYRRFEFEIPPKADEIREPHPAYDRYHRLTDHLQAVLALDLGLIEPDDSPHLHRYREALRASCEDEKNASERRVELLHEELSAFEDSYQAAALRAARRR